MKRKVWRRVTHFAIRASLLAAGGLGLIHWAWSEGAPMWCLLRGRSEQRAVIHWDSRSIEITNPAEVSRLAAAVHAGSNPLPYATSCLAEKMPENWSLTLYDQNGTSFQVWLGLDTCGAFYVPAVGSSYINTDVLKLVRREIKPTR